MWSKVSVGQTPNHSLSDPYWALFASQLLQAAFESTPFTLWSTTRKGATVMSAKRAPVVMEVGEPVNDSQEQHTRGGGNEIQFVEETIRRRTEGSLQRRKPVDQSAPEDGQGDRLGRTARRVRGASETNAGACKPLGGDLRGPRGKPQRKKGRGKGRP